MTLISFRDCIYDDQENVLIAPGVHATFALPPLNAKHNPYPSTYPTGYSTDV